MRQSASFISQIQTFISQAMSFAQRGRVCLRAMFQVVLTKLILA